MDYSLHCYFQTEILASLENSKSKHSLSLHDRVMSAIKLAERKLKENDFNFDHLPRDRQDPIWNELLKHPCQLSVQELSALKNARFISLGLFVDSLITINLFILILIFFLLLLVQIIHNFRLLVPLFLEFL